MVELAGGFGYNDADASFTGPGRTPWKPRFLERRVVERLGGGGRRGLGRLRDRLRNRGLDPLPVHGLRHHRSAPTYGRVSRHGAMALCWSLDKLGPLARSARDTEMVLRAIAGADPADPDRGRAPFPAPRRRPRIAVLKNASKVACPPSRATSMRRSSVLATYCDLMPGVALPDLPYAAAVGTIVNAEGAAAFRDLIESGRSRCRNKRTTSSAATSRTQRSRSITSTRSGSAR